MAANRQQGKYLAALMAACTCLPAGLVAWDDHPAIAAAAALAGAGLFVYSLMGFSRIKGLEFGRD